MIEIHQVQSPSGQRINHKISGESYSIDGKDLLLLPALIDPHVHFRTPGAEHKENWETAAQAALAGGVTTVFDMPNNHPSCITAKRLEEKKMLIDQQLKNVKIPLRYGLYFGADQNHLEEIPKVREHIVGLKIYMGSSTGDLLMDNPAALDKAFRIAAENDVLIAVHAEDEELIKMKSKAAIQNPKDDASSEAPGFKCKAAIQNPKDDASSGAPGFKCKAALHSIIRNPEVAAKAVTVAIDLAKKYHARLYIAHVSTKEELDLIRKAKNQGLSVYAEATPHHLFLNTIAYEKWGTRALVNPPLRDSNAALWGGIHDGTIDTIGTDHAPHLLQEKMQAYGKAPSGFPSIELYLPLLLNAYNEGKLSINQIVRLTHTRPQEIFKWPANDDVVLVDLKKTRTVDDAHLKTRAKWSPYAGMNLKGWPRYTILRGKVYEV